MPLRKTSKATDTGTRQPWQHARQKCVDAAMIERCSRRGIYRAVSGIDVILGGEKKIELRNVMVICHGYICDGFVIDTHFK